METPAQKYDAAEAEMRSAGRWPAEGVALKFGQTKGPREKAVACRQRVSACQHPALLPAVSATTDAPFACRTS